MNMAKDNATSVVPSLALFLAALLGLTLFFLFDDVLLYFVFERMLGVELSLAGRTAIVATLIVLNVGLAHVAIQALRQKPTTGAEGLVSEIGVVAAGHSGQTWVKVHGELWKATSNEELIVGEEVRILKIKGLVLEVEPIRRDKSS